MKQKARLVEVQGDQEDFADLIGTTGTLYLEGNNNWFLPENRGDHLSFVIKRKVNVAPDKVRVFTKLGNTFTFRLLTVPTEAVVKQNS
jgi:hypothetical protein